MSLKRLQDCFNKKAYKSIEQADNAADVIYHHTTNKLFVYQCDLCQKYHLTKYKNYFGKNNLKEIELTKKIKKALRR